jgi:hypothetical protein
MKMKNPPHFGRLVRQEFFEPLGLTVIEEAENPWRHAQSTQQSGELPEALQTKFRQKWGSG